MPIQNKDLGKYDRPDIFINEINDSFIDLPQQDTLINLVPGFSKNGPVMTPEKVSTPDEFKKIFGDIDKGLERKGSFFHRTCLKMLESGPIYALNLLLTNDDRDKANWKSISCASNYKNDITKNMPYSRLFNRQDFWKKDSETFLDYVNDPQVDYDRVLHLSNLGNKVTTTFIFKSKIKGFDITAEDWYNGKTNVPQYINNKDWVSDYIVSVLVLDGDWTQYDNLSSDQRWGNYFTKDGLDKNKVQNFVDEPTVNTLAYYDASLIPYFKDFSDRDMYIKNLINNDTNKTGLFCAYFEDEILDADFPIGKIDLIGQNLVGENISTDINFLSYKESIAENITYNETDLDDIGNVFGNYAILKDEFVAGSNRTARYTNHYVNGMTIGNTGSMIFKEVISFSAPSTISLASAGANINDKIFFNKDYDSIIGFNETKAYYIKSISGSEITISESIGGPTLTFVSGTKSDMYVTSIKHDYTATGTPSDPAYFNISNTSYSILSGASLNIQLDPIYFDDNIQSFERYDILYLSRENDAKIHILKGDQSEENSTAQKPYFTLDYNEHIILGVIKISLVSGVLNTSYNGITISNTGYIPFNLNISSGTTTSNYISIEFNGTNGVTDYTNYMQIRNRNKYDEIEKNLLNGKGVLISNNDASKYYITNTNLTTIDYNNTSNATIKIYGMDNASDYYSTSDLLLYYIDNEFNTPNSFKYIKSLTVNTSADTAIIGKYSNLYQDYYNGQINNGDIIYLNNNTGTTISNNNIPINGYFIDDLLSIDLDSFIIDFDTTYDKKIIIKSNNSSYKQTVEIEKTIPADILNPMETTYSIKVDKNRYNELIRGEFLEAYYNVNDLVYGESPKTLTRIIKVQNDLDDESLKILTCDAPINLTEYPIGSRKFNTMTYPTIDKYVKTYKGIKLTPFIISPESIPNGTEERQSNILNLLHPNTNLGKGLINKNKIQWRYLIDSFGLGLTSNSKQQYADLLGKKLNSFGFISAPSVKTFKKSTNPSFINDDKTLNTNYLKTGGDELKNPSFLYSFATGVGKSTIGYFFPYINVNNDGIPSDVPPAAYVATTYMQKFLTSSSAIQPWTIAAGISNGRLNGVGDVEMDFTDEDLSNLYGMGLNPIVKKAKAGYCINSESTAAVFPYSSLSVIHSREVLIELENALYDMLLRYQWRFNTGAIRAEIKYKADKICQDIENRDGLYYYNNVIDETNNTNYIIDLQMGVLYTYIEIIKGMGIIVNNITILKKGDIQSGGFSS